LQRLQRLRDDECARFESERRIRHARADAEKAWVVGDYQKVISVYAPYEASLTDSERKRLQLARKRCPGPSPSE
jgi:hypothetical protein